MCSVQMPKMIQANTFNNENCSLIKKMKNHEAFQFDIYVEHPQAPAGPYINKIEAPEYKCIRFIPSSKIYLLLLE